MDFHGYLFLFTASNRLQKGGIEVAGSKTIFMKVGVQLVNDGRK